MQRLMQLKPKAPNMIGQVVVSTGMGKFLQFLMWILALLIPLQEVVSAMFFLLTIDFITGIWASVHRLGWNSISARKMSRSVRKIIGYNILILTTYVVNIYLLPTIPIGMMGVGADVEQPLVRLVVGILAAIELRSVYENICVITGLKFQKTFVSLFRSLTDKDGNNSKQS